MNVALELRSNDSDFDFAVCHRMSILARTQMHAWRRVSAGAIIIAGALTVVLAARTFWYLFHSLTNVPFADQWVMLEEIWRRRAGQIGWSYLWSPYWGQRMLLPRLRSCFQPGICITPR